MVSKLQAHSLLRATSIVVPSSFHGDFKERLCIQIILTHWEQFFFLWRCDPTRAMASSFLRFLDHTQRRTTIGRTPLDEWSASRRDLYLTTHNTHNRQTSMPPAGFEPTISAGEAADLRLRPRSHWDLLLGTVRGQNSAYSGQDIKWNMEKTLHHHEASCTLTKKP